MYKKKTDSGRHWPLSAIKGPLCNCSCTEDESGLAPDCTCDEEEDKREWVWESPQNKTNWVYLTNNDTQVIFHPHYSAGTAAARGATTFYHNYIYYFEVKILTQPYGTDVMVGVGSGNVNVNVTSFQFRSFLGQDTESYGISYTGAVFHGGMVCQDSPGFTRGTIVGVKLDMWLGTLEFFINRQGLGVSFFKLRKHQQLHPMVSATSAQSAMRLLYASSWQASLLSAASKILANSTGRRKCREMMPPGLRKLMDRNFFLIMKSLSPESKGYRLLRQALYVRWRHFDK